MNRSEDPWHYPRDQLARDYLTRFDPGSAHALTLFAERRSGKSDFLVNDLTGVGAKAGLQPVYIDLWRNRNKPGEALAAGFEAAARRMEDPKFKPGTLLGTVEQVTSVNASVLGTGVGFTRTRQSERAGPTDTVSRVGYWGDRMMAVAKRPVLLMVDEVQAMAYVNNGVEISSALRAVMQSHGRLQLRAVFTGSSRDGIQRMFNRHQAAFYRYGSQMDFRPPGEAFVDFLADKARESSGIVLDRTALHGAYAQFNRRPGPMREMIEMMDRDRSGDVPKYFQREIGILSVEGKARMDLDSLKPIERGVLEAVLLYGKVYTRQAKIHVADAIGIPSDAVNSKLLTDATEKLRNQGMIVKLDRGDYRIDDSELAVHLEESFPTEKLRTAPKLGRFDRELQHHQLADKGKSSVQRAAASVAWLTDPENAQKAWPGFAQEMAHADRMIEAATLELRNKSVDPHTVELTQQALRQKLASDITAGKPIEPPRQHKAQGPER